MTSATAEEHEVKNPEGLVKKSIILTEETWDMAQQIQDLFLGMSLSALCRNLIEQYGPGILEAKTFPSMAGHKERNKVFLDDETFRFLGRIGKELGMAPAEMLRQIVTDSADRWAKKALEARDRMRRAAEELED